MKAKLEDGYIKFEISELLESLTEEQRRTVARFLVADRQLFAGVLECVANGSYFTDDEDGEWWFGSEAVLELREKLIPLMPEVAKLAVTEALKQRNAAKEAARRNWEWAWSLFHAWPERDWHLRPSTAPVGVYNPGAKVDPAEVESLFR